MTLTRPSNGQTIDATHIDQLVDLYKGGRDYDVVNGYGADPVGVADSTSAFNSAIDDANARSLYYGWPAQIVIPPGMYAFNVAALHTIRVPVVGAGIRRTILVCQTNLGASGTAGRQNPFLTFDMQGSNEANRIAAQGFTLIGPGTANNNGTHLNAGSGIESVQSLKFRDIEIDFFEHGFVNNCPYGHLTLLNCALKNNYYNYYNFVDHGDNCLIDCDLSGAAMASIGLPGGTRMDAFTAIRVHLGFCPYGIYQDGTTNGQNAGEGTMMSDCYFAQTRWESCGNGEIFTENWNVGSKGVLQDVEMVMPGGLADKPTGSYGISSRIGDYGVQVGQMTGLCRIRGGEYGIPNRAKGAFYIGALNGTLEYSGPGGYPGNSAAIFNVVSGAGNLRYGGARGSDSLGVAATSKLIDVGSYAGLTTQLVRVTPRGNGGLAAGFDLWPSAITSHPGLDFAATPGQITGSSQAAGNVPVGTHYYAMTFLNTFGEGALGSPGTTFSTAVVVSSTAKAVTLTLNTAMPYNFPGYSPITGRHIWRSDDGGVTFKRIDGVGGRTDLTSNVAASSFVDNVAANGTTDSSSLSTGTTAKTQFTVNLAAGAATTSTLAFDWQLMG